MKRWFLLALLFGFLPFAAVAAENGPSEQIPPGGTMRGRFTQEHYFKDSKKPLRSEGRFTVAPDYGLIWAIEKPVPLTVVVTPAGMTQGIGPMALMRTDASRMPFLGRVTNSLADALAGNWSRLETEYSVKHEAVGKGWQTRLTPHADNPAIPFQSLTARGSAYVENAKLIRQDGGLEAFTFSDQSVSPSPPTQQEILAFEQTAKKL